MMAAMRVKEVREGGEGFTTNIELLDDVMAKEEEEDDDGGEVDYRWVHNLCRCAASC